MPNLSLGTIEVLGLPAAIAAADVALKTADVKLIGYETTDGMGMVAVKIEGQVSAVTSAIHAACAAASAITKVFATSVIPRPSEQLEPVVLTDVTVGLAKPAPKPAPAPKPEPEPEPEPAPAEPEPTLVDATPEEPEPAAPAEPATAPEPVPATAPAAEAVTAPAAPPAARKKTTAPARRRATGSRTTDKK